MLKCKTSDFIVFIHTIPRTLITNPSPEITDTTLHDPEFYVHAYDKLQHKYLM